MTDIRLDPDEMRRRGYDETSIEDAARARDERTRALKLINQIEGTFRDIPRPRITLHVARELDARASLSSTEMEALARLDPESDWRDVSDRVIANHQDYFAFADADGCRFYLPAFMRQTLREFPFEGWDAALVAAGNPKNLSALTAAERACVDAFVHMVEKKGRSPA